MKQIYILLTANPFVTLVFTKENNQFHDLVKTNNKSLLLSNNVRKIHKNIIYIIVMQKMY